MSLISIHAFFDQLEIILGFALQALYFSGLARFLSLILHDSKNLHSFHRHLNMGLNLLDLILLSQKFRTHLPSPYFGLCLIKFASSSGVAISFTATTDTG